MTLSLILEGQPNEYMDISTLCRENVSIYQANYITVSLQLNVQVRESGWPGLRVECMIIV